MIEWHSQPNYLSSVRMASRSLSILKLSCKRACKSKRLSGTAPCCNNKKKDKSSLLYDQSVVLVNDYDKHTLG
jgi:hypothetical protein